MGHFANINLYLQVPLKHVFWGPSQRGGAPASPNFFRTPTCSPTATKFDSVSHVEPDHVSREFTSPSLRGGPQRPQIMWYIMLYDAVSHESCDTAHVAKAVKF